MAYSTGTATSHRNLMVRLKSFLLSGTHTGGSGTTLPVGERWTADKDTSAEVAGQQIVYFKSPANSGVNTHINIRVYDDPDGINYFNWHMTPHTSFDTNVGYEMQPGAPLRGNSTLTLLNQTGYGGPRLTLANSSFQYWIIANARRFIVVANINGTWAQLYCGLILPYATPSEFPYPVFVGGNGYRENSKSTTPAIELGTPYDPITTSAALQYSIVVNSTNYFSSYLRVPQGSYLAFANFYKTSNARGNRLTNTAGIWPWNYFQASVESYTQIPSAESLILPCVLYSSFGADYNSYGELEGVHWLPGVDRAPGDTLTISAVTYLIVRSNNGQDNDFQYAAISLA